MSYLRSITCTRYLSELRTNKKKRGFSRRFVWGTFLDFIKLNFNTKFIDIINDIFDGLIYIKNLKDIISGERQVRPNWRSY